MSDPNALITFRDTLRAICPPWLQNGLAQRILYAIMVPVDAAGDALLAGVKMRFPGLYSDESLALIGRERRIRRGINEDAQNYAARLVRWREDHRRRGGAYALLWQLYYHYAPNNFPIALWYPSGKRYLMNAAGDITWAVPVIPVRAARWARWQLLYFTDTIDASMLDDIVQIPRDWIAAHCFGEIIVMPAGAELWDYPPDRLWDNPRAWNTPDVSLRVTVR